MTTAEVFRSLYEDDGSIWGNSSGDGSNAYYNIPYRAFLENFIKMNNVKSFVDIGCGDWTFSRFIDLSGCSYHGFDVVESVVRRNRERFASDTVRFDLMPDNMADVPQADLLVMKDVLQHLPDKEIMRHREELFSRFPRCLLTNSYRKSGVASLNYDVEAGDFRCLDLNAAPYLFGGSYVLEFSSPIWEEIRTLLYTPNGP